jgi:hypothetical protein
MNISPATYSALIHRVDQLTDQVAALFALVGQRAKRDPSINGFCARQGISRKTYERLRAAGAGPRETAAGRNRITIADEDERAWVKARQDAIHSERSERGRRPPRSLRGGEAMTPAE